MAEFETGPTYKLTDPELVAYSRILDTRSVVPTGRSDSGTFYFGGSGTFHVVDQHTKKHGLAWAGALVGLNPRGLVLTCSSEGLTVARESDGQYSEVETIPLSDIRLVREEYSYRGKISPSGYIIPSNGLIIDGNYCEPERLRDILASADHGFQPPLLTYFPFMKVRLEKFDPLALINLGASQVCFFDIVERRNGLDGVVVVVRKHELTPRLILQPLSPKIWNR